MNRKLRRSAMLLFIVMCVATWGSAAFAAVPRILTEQGRLLDASGMPVTGSVMLAFNLYDNATSGTTLWTETQTVDLDSGNFSVNLGENTPFDVLFKMEAAAGKTLYLGITVNTDAEMAPRQTLLAVPYAIVADNAVGDITPSSVSVAGAVVIDGAGKWVGSVAGLQGPQGVKGDPGVTGAQGAAGPQGAKGDPGATGAQGAAGPQGAKGDPGATGAQGAAGPQGAKGDPGATGAQGAAGPQGSAGVPCSGCVGDGSIQPGALGHSHGFTTQVVSTATVVAAGGSLQQPLTCPVGTTITGGGCGAQYGGPLVTTNLSAPVSNGWTCWFTNQDSVGHSGYTYAVCATSAGWSHP